MCSRLKSRSEVATAGRIPKLRGHPISVVVNARTSAYLETSAVLLGSATSLVYPHQNNIDPQTSLCSSETKNSPSLHISQLQEDLPGAGSPDA